MAPVAAVVLVLVALVAVWTVDAARTRGKVQRNVSVGGVDVGGLTPVELQGRVADIAARFAATPVSITATSADGAATQQFSSTAGDVGLVVDQAATMGQALRANRSGGPAFMEWVRSFGDGSDVTPVVTLVEPKALGAATGFATTVGASAVEPLLERRPEGLGVVAGSTGTSLDPATIVEALRPLRYTTAPIALQVPLERPAPTLDVITLQTYADQVNGLTAAPLVVKAGSATVEIAPETLRSWVRVPSPESLELTLDDSLVATQLAATLAAGGSEPVDASLALEGDPLAPVISGGTDGTLCCAPEAPAAVLAALQAGGGAAQAAPLELPMVVEPPAITRASIEALGIIEPVATFTTRHACCEQRVRNIHRMADIVDGYIIPPGEMLSINEFVGPRTAAKGFVAGPAIIDGSLGDTELGGGISQYMTTLFNAAWFAGLNFGEYSSHSIYISRYPYGREATVNYPHPDFQVVNKLPYGVLIQNTYTETEITVTIWSTVMFSNVEQTGQEEFRVEQACKGVRTFRTKTYLDGTQETGATRAVYRDTAGIDCDGSPGGDD